MKRFARISALAAALALLFGCTPGRGVHANYRPIEELWLVQTLGLDADGGALLLSAAGRPADGSGPETVFRRAASLPQGFEALQEHTPRGILYFAHTRNIVLGQSFAAQGLGGLLDYVERDVSTRMGAALFVMRGGSARSLLCGAGEDWDVSDVLASVRAETGRRGGSHVFDVRETAVALSEYGAALVCALRATAVESSVAGTDGSLSAVPDGYGILRDGRLVGFLEGDEALAASLLLGKAGEWTWELPDGAGGTLTAALSAGSPKYTVSQTEAGLLLTVAAAPEAAIAALDVRRPRAASEEALCAEIERRLTASITGAFAREAAENADFLALGRVLRERGVDPAALPPDWLQTLEVRVSVDASVRHGYDMGAPAGTDGGTA